MDKCPASFEVTDSSISSGCLRKVTVGRLVSEGAFVDDAMYCARNDVVVIYRYLSENGIDEIRAYVEPKTCNAKNKDKSYDASEDKYGKEMPLCKYPIDNTSWTNSNYSFTYGCDPVNSANGCKTKLRKITVDESMENYPISWTIEDNAGNKVDCSYDVKVLVNSGKEVIYTIFVKRLDENESIEDYPSDINVESDNRLESMYINGYDIKFDKDIFEYYVPYEGYNILDIYVSTIDKNAKYSIIGNDDLGKGSIISVVVTGSDMSNREYKIYVGEEKSDAPVVIEDEEDKKMKKVLLKNIFFIY